MSQINEQAYSGVPTCVHFGFPKDTEIDSLEIRCSDGRTAPVEHLDPATLITITRGLQ